MNDYYLINFDGKLLFHNDRKLRGIVKFIGFSNIDEAIKSLLKQKFIVKNIFFQDDNGEYRSILNLDPNFEIYEYDEIVSNGILDYYIDNPEKFLKCLENTYNQITSFCIVNCNEILFKILQNHNYIDESDTRHIIIYNNSI